MKEAGRSYVTGDGWFGQQDGETSIAGVEFEEEGNVMIEIASLADWTGEEAKLDRQVKLDLSPIDALTFAERIRLAAVDAIQGVAQDPKSELNP